MAACASVDEGESSSPSLVTHVVGMRKKAEPQLPENSFGNFAWQAPASSQNDEPNRDLENLFGKVRSAVRKIDSEFMKTLQGEDGYRKCVDVSWKEFPEKADYLMITSWCNFGLYGVDFGWGRPIWLTMCDRYRSDAECPFFNMLWLMDTREGDVVEAWVLIDEEYGARFDENEELRALAKVSPSPLDIAGIMIDS